MLDFCWAHVFFLKIHQEWVMQLGWVERIMFILLELSQTFRNASMCIYIYMFF